MTSMERLTPSFASRLISKTVPSSPMGTCGIAASTHSKNALLDGRIATFESTPLLQYVEVFS
jgi:hypothetical protein